MQPTCLDRPWTAIVVDGKSEERIGEAFGVLGTTPAARPTVVTKIGMTEMVDPDLCPDAATAMSMVEASIATSQTRLQAEQLDVVLLHNFAGYSKLHSGAPWKRLVQARDVDHSVRRVGVSCYSPDEAMEALRDPDMQHIQLPVSCTTFMCRPIVSAAPNTSLVLSLAVQHAR